MMNRFFSTLAAAALFAASPAAPAFAQASAGIAVGMPVTDAQGGAVGVISAIKGDNVMVRTDKHEALLPASSFRNDNGKLLFGMTRAQLNAEIEKGLAAAQASLAAGATVVGLQGTPVGVIESISEQNATIKLASGRTVTVPLTGLRGNPNGSVTLGLTAAQLEAAVGQEGSAEAAQ